MPYVQPRTDRNSMIYRTAVGLATAILVTGCGGSGAPATSTPEPSWTPPEDLEVMAQDGSLAYRWDTSPECDIADRCFGMYVASRDGCSTLYVELTILDKNGTVIGSTNDTASGLRPQETAKLVFDTVENEADTARIADVRCR